MILLNFHGDEGDLIMPELGEEVYEEEEPKGDFGQMRFGAMRSWTERR